MEATAEVKQKRHSKRAAGPKADKKKRKSKAGDGEDESKQKNAKAFTYRSAVRAARAVRRNLDRESKRQHVPLVDRTPLEPPPVLVAVVGPPGVGKTTLIAGLVKNFTRQNLSDHKGPVTVVSGKKRRLTFIECGSDINTMIDVAKVADLVLLLVDASFGFEMETFEFLNILQVHGFPKVMGVLTHLDMMKDNKSLKSLKKRLKHRFWTEIYQGAKLFYLSRLVFGQYSRQELHNLARFISVMKFRPLEWRSSHPYVLADRMEDLTAAEEVRQNCHCDRTVSLYGYVRGCSLQPSSRVHIPGCGDFSFSNVTALPDPCPLLEKEKKRSLDMREKLIYAPMSGIGGIVYDKDAVYIELGGSHHVGKKNATNELLSDLMDAEQPLDARMSQTDLILVSDAFVPVEVDGCGDERVRRSVPLQSDGGSEADAESDTGSSEEEVKHQERRRRRRKRRQVVISESSNSEEGEEEEVELLAGTEQQVRTGTADMSSWLDDEAEEGEPGSDEEQNMSWEEEEEEEGSSNSCYTELVDNEAKEAGRSRTRRSWAGSPSSSDEQEEMMAGSGDVEASSDPPLAGHLRWKAGLTHRAEASFDLRRSRTASLRAVVYGGSVQLTGERESLSEDELGGLFHVRKPMSEEGVRPLFHQHDSSVVRVLPQRDWSKEETAAGVKHLFVTGSWGLEDAWALIDENQSTAEESGKEEEEGEEMVRERLKKKKELKKSFDADYDNQEDVSYYDDLKQQMSEQAERNRAEFEGMDEGQRIAYEGFRQGTYVRMEIKGMPCEFVRHFDPSYPVIVGGLQVGEDRLGYVRVRVKRHRWHKRLLKSGDPLVVSVGWRRFQTVMVYSMEDHNGRHRMLKYTPEHMHCSATFYGPLTLPSIGFLGVQSVSGATPDFRVAATGVVVDVDRSVAIVKKLKLTGVPYKIFRNTAFIRGMFSSSLECSRFEGAAIRTVSGLRGQIKRALRSPPGAFRATFEDRLLMSDIVFVRTWYPVSVPRYYNPVTSLLCPDKRQWTGMRTVGQLRHELGQKVTVRRDSAYHPVVRETRHFNALKIPPSLEKQLPFKSRPKLMGKHKKGPTRGRAVVLEPQERRVLRLMDQLTTLHKEKLRKRRQSRRKAQEAHLTKRRKEEERKDKHTRVLRKKFYRELGLAEQKGEKRRKVE